MIGIVAINEMIVVVRKDEEEGRFGDGYRKLPLRVGSMLFLS